MRVVVTGGRDFADSDKLNDVLSTINEELGITLLAHGSARGADLLAESWAKANEVPYLGVPAKWKTGKRGKAEGIIRNGVLLDLVKPDLVLAFPGGVGTANCIKQAVNKGYVVREIV